MGVLLGGTAQSTDSQDRGKEACCWQPCLIQVESMDFQIFMKVLEKTLSSVPGLLHILLNCLAQMRIQIGCCKENGV